MEIEYSKHWLRKSLRKRKDITDDMIEFAFMNSRILRDKYWEDALNAVARVSPSGRILKVVYKRRMGKVFILTAYWLD